MRKILSASAVIFLLCGTAEASPWGRKPSEVFLAPQISFYSATKYWDGEGELKSIGCDFKKVEVALYGEYGLKDSYTLIFKIPYQSISCSSRTEGLSDLEIGIQKRLAVKQPNALSLKLKAIIPTGYSIDTSPRLGYGRLGLEFSALAGRGFDRAFLEGALGYRLYFGYPSDQIRAYGRLGLKPMRRFMLMGTLELQYGLKNGTSKVVGQNIVLQPYYRLLQADVSAVWKLKKSVQLVGGITRALWGRNTGEGKTVYGQLWLAF